MQQKNKFIYKIQSMIKKQQTVTSILIVLGSGGYTIVNKVSFALKDLTVYEEYRHYKDMQYVKWTLQTFEDFEEGIPTFSGDSEKVSLTKLTFDLIVKDEKQVTRWKKWAER